VNSVRPRWHSNAAHLGLDLRVNSDESLAAAADFMFGILLFWFMALVCYRTVSDDEQVTDVRGLRGILSR